LASGWNERDATDTKKREARVAPLPEDGHSSAGALATIHSLVEAFKNYWNDPSVDYATKADTHNHAQRVKQLLKPLDGGPENTGTRSARSRVDSFLWPDHLARPSSMSIM